MTLERRMFTGLRLAFLGISFFFFMLSAFPTEVFSNGKIASYSADMVMIKPDGEISGTAKLYITPEAYRMDGMLLGAGQHGMPKDMTTLGLKDQNRQFIYNHDKKLVYESDFDEQEMMKRLNTYQDAESEVVLGKEKVSGYTCVKKKVTTTTTVMGMKVTSTQITWQSDRFEMPLRTQTEEGYVSELRNIDTKKPSAKVFHPLTGYTPVGNIVAVMGMDFSAGGERSREREKPKQAEKVEEEAGVADVIRGVGKGIRGLIGR